MRQDLAVCSWTVSEQAHEILGVTSEGMLHSLVLLYFNGTESTLTQ